MAVLRSDARMLPAPRRAVRPRDAASLVIHRGEGAGARVLLGRRPAHDRFMPNVWVFPGGRMDAEDLDAPYSGKLDARVEASLGRRVNPVTARALAIAALRETFEETGLVFGARAGEGVRPDLSSIGYLARAITPSNNPIRYHARFLHAPAEAATGKLRSNGELLDLQWFAIEDALQLEIIDVTEAVLGQLAARLEGDAPRDLMIHYRSGRRILRRE